MSTVSAIIEINGQAYDAFSGHPLGSEEAPRPQNIDGILPADEAPQYLNEAAKLAPAPLTRIVSRPSLRDVVRPAVNAMPSHQPQPAHTLMRRAVHKPQSAPHHIKVQGPATHAQGIKVKKSVTRIDPDRLARAQQAEKSAAVRRFQPVVASFIVSEGSPSAVAPTHSEVSAPNFTAQLLERALQSARSHQQSAVVPPRRFTPKVILLSISFAAVVVATGLFAAGSLTNLKVGIAGAKAGFSAALPTYHPSGYHLASVTSSSGTVASDFLSNSDQRAYTLTEKASNWDSAALLENFVQPNASGFQTAEANGITVYIYGNHQATWVNHGVWYRLSSNGSLSDHQLVELATSL